MNRFSVVSLHFTRECNLNCSFCYRPKELTGKEKSLPFFIDCVKYMKELAPQVALGGGEPFMFPGFMNTLGNECSKHGMTLNVTTNGTLIRGMDNVHLHQAVKDVAMVSVSLDHGKWHDLREYACVVRRLKSAKPGLLVGTNLLLEPGYFEEHGKPLYFTIEWCIKKARVDRVFLLYPKNVPLGVDIVQYKDFFSAISTMFPGSIFVDDLTRQILEHGYPPWNVPCHHGRDIVSIDEEGGVHGCSFDTAPVLKMAVPSDLLGVKDIPFESRLSCPYLKRD
ncbi:MAG: radical SAM protein [Candidatus Sigynarchaeota archaeon]